MPTTIPIPDYFNIRTMYGLINAVMDGKQRPRYKAVDFDFSHLCFAEPDGMTVLANLCEWLKKREVKIDFVGCDVSRAATRYLDDCGFFEEYQGSPLSSRAGIRSTTQRFRRLSCEQCHDWLDQTVPWLANCLSANKTSLAELKSGVREIFLNIQDHSTEEIGCAHIQWFPQGSYVHISISDFGIGIPTEIRSAFDIKNDSDALAHSIKEGVTSKRGSRNKGAGLHCLLDNVVNLHKGRVDIHSNGAKLIASKSSGQMIPSASSVSGFYPGTLISILLWQDRLRRVADEREDLEW